LLILLLFSSVRFSGFLSIETSRLFSSLGLDPNSKSSPSRDASYRLSFRVHLRVRFHTAFWLLNTHQKIRSLFRRLSRKTQCATGTKNIRVNAPFKTIDIYGSTLQDDVSMNKLYFSWQLCPLFKPHMAFIWPH
jgi:hypothetical protein